MTRETLLPGTYDLSVEGTQMFETTTEDRPYLRHGELELLARIYRPMGRGAPTGELPVLVEVHGGAWCDNDRRAGKLYNTAMAAAGFLVVAIDFRMGPDHRHPAASDDVTAAVEWVRTNATDIGADPRRVALAGSSSGGHLALHAALHLDDPVIGVVALWPPTHPLRRFRYASSKPDDHGRRLVTNTLAYFGDEDAMGDAAIARIVADREYTNLPPVWLVHPSDDLNVPREITDELEHEYRTAGGDIDVWHVEGQPHAFGHFEGEATDEFVGRFRDRLLLWADT